jgi:hypothetical protein
MAKQYAAKGDSDSPLASTSRQRGPDCPHLGPAA